MGPSDTRRADRDAGKAEDAALQRALEAEDVAGSERIEDRKSKRG
jgi:hypothetical protein